MLQMEPRLITEHSNMDRDCEGTVVNWLPYLTALYVCQSAFSATQKVDFDYLLSQLVILKLFNLELFLMKEHVGR